MPFFSFIRNWRRRQLAKKPMPENWKKILVRQVPFYRVLSPEKQKKLESDLKVFAWEKHFIASQGVHVTEEMKVIISACAARLIQGLDLSFYDRLTEIVIYEDAFHNPELDQVNLGEAHDWGVVVLSWKSVLEGIRNPKDSANTAYHEFAHVLDRATGAFDGTPELACRHHFQPWAKVMSKHFLKLQKGKTKQLKALDEYGAKNEAEFFAVATEVYFENPDRLKKHTPDLFRVLDKFYGSK